MSETREQPAAVFPAKVIDVIDEYRVVINRGSREGLKNGMRVVVYAVGKEDLIDPDTGENLGKLEIVRGIGTLTNVQPKIATVKSAMKRPAPKTIVRRPWGGLAGLGGEEEVHEAAIDLPFDEPEKGDFVRPA